jgi:hypothetical protein
MLHGSFGLIEIHVTSRKRWAGEDELGILDGRGFYDRPDYLI